YYLTALAEQLGYHPQVILAGRRINDSIGRFIAERTVKLIAAGGGEIQGARIGVFGLTFKENVPDLRNSRVPDILAELKNYGARPLVHDPIADADEAEREYGLKLQPAEALTDLAALILAVPHRAYLDQPIERLTAGLRQGGVVIDVKSALGPEQIAKGTTYWSL
uniref:UDP binding domain-containing protein n=1 Tax=Afifella pfennigii TaxID=209897 RepID=UPI000478AE8C